VRNCAWINAAKPVNKKAVWVRKDTVSLQCPKSVISAQSKAFLQQFRWWKQFGGGFPWWVDAKTADALLVLEEAWRIEEQNGKV
jgi:hypothetical protein